MYVCIIIFNFNYICNTFIYSILFTLCICFINGGNHSKDSIHFPTNEYLFNFPLIFIYRLYYYYINIVCRDCFYVHIGRYYIYINMTYFLM